MIGAVLLKIDQDIVIHASRHRKHPFDLLMILSTRVGDGWLWLISFPLILIFDRNGNSVIQIAGIAVLMELALYRLLKKCCSRPRPYKRFDFISCPVLPTDEYSFPSGHMATATVMFLSLGFIYPWLYAPLLLVSVLIGISRVYLGAHYPSDVVAGAVLGLFCVLFSRWILS